MSVQEVTYYQAVCDDCGAVDDDGDFSAWGDTDSAVEAAEASDWTLGEDGKLRCQACSEPDFAVALGGAAGTSHPTGESRSTR